MYWLVLGLALGCWSVGVDETTALLQLYSSTRGDFWANKMNWGNGDPCQWFGVDCSLGNVSGLSLVNNNLVGTIPEAIGDITALSSLYLQYNHLNGTLPDSFVTLTNLIWVDLSNNKLEGTISSKISSLSQLKELSLSSNNLGGPIPDSLTKITTFNFLYLNMNQFSGSIPSDILSIPNLKQLDLNTNSLIGTLPSNMNSFDLTSLNVAYNGISGTLPTNIGLLSSLSYLLLFHNQLIGTVPTQLGNLKSLTSLQISYNNFTGTIPVEISSLPLVSFFVDSNPHLCVCYTFQSAIPNCQLSNVATNCVCPYLPCGNNPCAYNSSCVNVTIGGCSGFETGLGHCVGDTLVIDANTLNQKRNFTLSQVKGIITGDVSISTVNLYNSNISLQGDLSGLNSILTLENSTLTISGHGNVVNSSIYMDVYSTIKIVGMNVQGTQITIDFKNKFPEKMEYIFISMFNSVTTNVILINLPFKCDLKSVTNTSSHVSIVFYRSEDGCSSNLNSNIVIGCVVGVLGLALILGILFGIKRRNYLKAQIKLMRYQITKRELP